MVLPDSTSHHAAAHQHHHQAHNMHHDEPKTIEFAALEAQFFEYNQIGDSLAPVGFNYDAMMQHQPSNEFGLSLDLMNLPPPAYAAHHLPQNSSSGGQHGHPMDMESSPLYQPMEAMSINPTMTTMSPHPQSANINVNPNMLQHNPSPAPGSTPSHQIPLPPSPTGSAASGMHLQHHQQQHHQQQHQHQQQQYPHHINTQMIHSPMGLMSSDLSAGALSSACSSAGSPESHRGSVSLPTIEQKDLREPAHGRTGSNASDKSSQRFNPMKGARGSASPTAGGATGAGASGPGRVTRKRAGTNNSLREKKEDLKASLKEENDSDDDDLDFAPSTSKTDKREEIRKQRIESEQRRRDELREGYRRLKEALPSSNQKSSKVALLDRAVNHVRYMEMTRQQLQARLNNAEMEMARLRQVNEALMLGTAEQRAAAAAASAAVQQHVQPQY